MAASQTIDVNIPRFSQSVVGILTAGAFVFQFEWLIAIVAITLLVSRFYPRLAPLTLIYQKAIRPRLTAPIETEAADPPRFAQLLGGIVLTAATLAFLADLTAIGWALALLVTVLATLAATARVCVGCLIYERAFR